MEKGIGEDMEDEGTHGGWRRAWWVEQGRSYQINLMAMYLVSGMSLLHAGISGFIATVRLNLLFSVKRKTRWILRARCP